MRRRLCVGVVAAVAASLWVAPSASAQVTHCTSNAVPGQTIVVIGPGQVNVFPQNVGPYAGDVLDWATNLAICIVDEAAGPLVACASEFVANRPTVTVNPQTLQITIDYEDFLNTACRV